MSEYLNALLHCESCEFESQVIKEAIRHSGETGHALTGENAENGTTVTVQLLTDDDE